MLARSVAWIEEEETIVQALPIIVAPVAGIVLVTLLYVTMMFDHELVKVTSEDHCIISIAGYYTLIRGNLSPGVMYQWIMCWMSWPRYIDSLIRSEDTKHVRTLLCCMQGASLAGPPPAPGSNVRVSRPALHSHSSVDRETGHLHLMTNALEASLYLSSYVCFSAEKILWCKW